MVKINGGKLLKIFSTIMAILVLSITLFACNNSSGEISESTSVTEETSRFASTSSSMVESSESDIQASSDSDSAESSSNDSFHSETLSATPTDKITINPTLSPTIKPVVLSNVFYVDPVRGNDNFTGTSKDKAFKTIAKARDAVRAINADMNKDITVYLRGGTYRISETVKFENKDSGMNGFNIRYMNYPGEIPIISGGETISGWTLHDSGKNIYKIEVGDLNFRQLYVNDERAIRARTKLYDDLNWDIANKKVSTDGSNLSNWNNFTQVELMCFFGWSETYLRLSTYSINNSRAYLEIQPLLKDIVFEQAKYRAIATTGNRFWFENAYEFIDSEGEWYLDRSVKPHVLYYKPKTGENMLNVNVIAPKVEKLFDIKGSLDSKVHNIIFYGLTFSHSNWVEEISEIGVFDLQFGQYSTNSSYTVKRPPGAVQAAALKDVAFIRNTFKDLGAVGLNIFYGSENVVIKGNVFKNIASSGLQLARFQPSENSPFQNYEPQDKRDLSRNDIISNNYFEKCSNIYFGAVPLAVGYGVNTIIEHNFINGSPYSGIHLGGHAMFSSDPNSMKGLIVRHNYIKDIMQDLNDGGHIYSKGKQDGEWIVSYNYLQQTVRPPSGATSMGLIYRDNASSYSKDIFNVLDDPNGFFAYSYYLNNDPSYSENLFDNNFMHDTKTLNVNPSMNKIQNNVTFPWPEKAYEIIEKAGLEEEFKDIISEKAAPHFS